MSKDVPDRRLYTTRSRLGHGMPEGSQEGL